MNRFDYNPPDTRERVAARRKARAPRRESARPGPRRVVGSWLASGRIFSLLLLIASLGGTLYVFTAPRFSVQDVRVEGVRVVSADEIINLAEAGGQSIWHVDTDQIVERLKTSAYIEQARASVTLPDQLHIAVVERRPEVRWASGGVQYLVDGDGRVLGTEDTIAITNTLVIQDMSMRVLEPNDLVDADALMLGQSLALRLPGELNVQPASIAWNTDSGMFVTMADQRKIIFGTSERLDEKFTVLGALLKDGTPFTYLDLRPQTPFYRNETGD